MVRNEWQFKIPEILKVLTKEGITKFSVCYTLVELPNGETSITKVISTHLNRGSIQLVHEWEEDDKIDFETSLSNFLERHNVGVEDL